MLLLFFLQKTYIFNVTAMRKSSSFYSLTIIFRAVTKKDLIAPIKEQSRARHPHANPSPLPKNALDRSHFLLDVPWLHLSRHFAPCHFPSRPPGLHAPRARRAEKTLGSRRGCSLSSTAVQTGQWQNAGRDFACEKEELRGKQQSVFVLAERPQGSDTSHVFGTEKVCQIFTGLFR